MAKTKTSATELRDLCGSQLFEFTFDLLSLPTEIGTAISRDLPIGKHFSNGGIVISHKIGKKSYTEFKLIDNIGPYEHWQATTRFLRQH